MGIAMQDPDHEIFWTYFEFNSDNAMISGDIWNKDIEAMLARFTVSNKIVLKFQLRARIVGSTNQGINAGLDAIVNSHFEVHITDSSTAATCADNVFRLADNSYVYTDASRETDFEFLVPMTGSASTPTIIPARRLVGGKDNCPIETTLQCFMPEAGDGTVMGEWREVFSNDFHTQRLTVAEGMKVEFDATQAQYVEEIAPYFESVPGSEQSVLLKCAFRHFDPVSETEVFDEFNLYVHGSGETAADLCGYEAASVKP
jgi:hypothetical protein